MVLKQLVVGKVVVPVVVECEQRVKAHEVVLVVLVVRQEGVVYLHNRVQRPS